MHGTIVYNRYFDNDAYRHQIRRMEEALSALGVEVSRADGSRFRARIENGKVEVEDRPDFCVFLDKDIYLSRMLEARGVRLFNSAKAVEDCDDKMLTYIALADRGIRMPDTASSQLMYDPSMQQDDAFFDVLERRYGYPMVVKECFGSRGTGVHLAEDRAELERLSGELKGVPHLYQRFIGSSRGEDLRVIAVGGRAVGGMIRRSESDFRSNCALGGTAEPYEVDEETAATVRKVSRALGLDYCGVDLLKDGTGRYSVVCEVNSNAFFQSFEACTGKDVAGAYAEHIVRAMQKRR